MTMPYVSPFHHQESMETTHWLFSFHQGQAQRYSLLGDHDDDDLDFDDDHDHHDFDFFQDIGIFFDCHN